MELLERVVELSLEGYCCSQVMALLLLELLGEEDDGFVRAMGGLINGGGYSGGDCGCMSGGACLNRQGRGKRRRSSRARFRAVPFYALVRRGNEGAVRRHGLRGNTRRRPAPQDGALPGDNGAVL